MGHPDLDRVLVSKRKTWVKGLETRNGRHSITAAYRFIKQLRDTHYDVILDFQGLLKSGILIGLARGHRKLGFDKGMEHAEESHIFLNERIKPVDMEIHALTRGMMLLEAGLGITNSEIVYNLPVSQRGHDLAEALLQQSGIRNTKPLVAIHPAAKWDTKLWDNRKFADLADRLITECHAQVIFTGGKADVNLIGQIRSDMKNRACDVSGRTTLKSLAALYARTDCVISTDTGPMHLAAAVGTPVVALFGPTAPWRTGPFGKNHRTVRAGIDCSPCFKRACKTKACMSKISVEDVLSQLKTIKPPG